MDPVIKSEKASAPTSHQAETIGKTTPLRRLAARLGTWTLSIAFGLLILFMVVWYGTPYVLRDYLNKRGDSLPDYHLTIDWVQINPLNCSLDLINLTLLKKSNQIPVPFFVCPKVKVAMQWQEILHWSLRSRISLFQPTVNFVEGPTEATSQTALEPEWVSAVKKLVPLRINQFQIKDGDIHFYDFHADPEINMEMDQLELSLDNLTNSNGTKSSMPSTAEIYGRPFRRGHLVANLALNVDDKPPTFAEKISLENVPAPALNAFLAKYGSVYAKTGNIAFYTEMVSADGSFKGYLKPFFQDLEFEPVPKDRNGLAAIWASLVNGAKDILQNGDKNVATTIPISGKYKDPNVDFWTAAFGLLRNAYLQALTQGFQTPQLAPDPQKQVINADALQQAKQQK